MFTTRRVGPVITTSSSSAASAEDPRTPFGLGDRRLGDPDPELVVPSPVAALPVMGRPMGARGRVIGPGPEPTTGEDVEAESGLRIADERRLEPGASIEGAEDVNVNGLGFGGPIGVSPPEPPRVSGTPIGGIDIDLVKETAGSNEGPALKLCGIVGCVIGAPGGCCILGLPYGYWI